MPLGKNATAGDYVKDFRKSKAPQFKGKSKAKKDKMAVAAYLSAKDKMDEGTGKRAGETWEAGYKRRVVKTTKPEHKNKEKGLGGEVGSSLNQILITMGVSVLWAIILIIVNFQLEQKGFEFSGLDTKAVVWPIGTAIWTLFLLSSQSKAGTLLSMDLSNRIKTSIGIGLATTLSLMLTDGEMQAITNVWGWTMTIALCAFLLSGFVRGIISSLRKISKMVGI